MKNRSLESSAATRSRFVRTLAMATCLAGVPGLARGQERAPYPPLKWVAQESLPGHSGPSAHDEGVDLVYWFEDATEDRHWIYATGFVTEMDGETVVGTRFATYKYDGAFFDDGDPPPPEAEAYFPPLTTTLQSGDTYKAVAMVVNPDNGDIYVTGEGPDTPGGTDQDYVLVKYDKDLNIQWGGARYYDGPVSGDDIPADLALDGCFTSVIVVTGTSPGSGTGLDIATAGWYTSSGIAVWDLWPPSGVRRYNNDTVDGDDRAAKVADVCSVQHLNDLDLVATVLGTSWGGTTENDYTLHQWYGTRTAPYWEYRYDNGANDVAVDVEQGYYITGYSEDSTASLGPGDPDIDVATVAYVAGQPTHEWARRWDYAGEPNYCTDLEVAVGACHPIYGCRYHIWITGFGLNGSRTDATTIMYGDGWGGLALEYTDGYDSGGDFQYGKAITTYAREPYLTGAQGGSDWDRALHWVYYEDSPFTPGWYRVFHGGGPFIADPAPEHEGRAIAVAVVDGDGQRSIYVTGVSTVSGEGRQFTTWRYKE